MGNILDETKGPFNDEGREVRVIDKRIPVTIDFFSVLFEIFVWAIGFVIAILIILACKKDISEIAVVVLLLCAFIPGIAYTISKLHAKNYFMRLEQEVQNAASEVGNYQDERFHVLSDVADLVKKSIELDTKVMLAVAAYRSGATRGTTGEQINANQELFNRAYMSLMPRIEAYPELKSHALIAEAMRQDRSLYEDVRSARTLYNETVLTWNRELFVWPVQQIVAARSGFTTRIPFTASIEVIEGSKKRFFESEKE